MITRSLIRFYDTPRSRLICFLGGFLVFPLLYRLRGEVARDTAKLNDKTILLGRLEITGALLQKWYR